MWAARILSACLAFVASVLLAQCQTLTFSTYLGVADCDGIALGSNGDLYLACHSPSNRLPIEVRPPKQSAAEGDTDPFFDAYVLRVNPQTGKLIYATRIGGSDYDGAFKIKVDPQGFAYAVGITKSHDFPTTPNAVQRQYGGGKTDAFLVKVSPDGEVVYSTLLGGGGADDGDALELDGHGGVFVGGTTESNDFPGQARPRTPSKGDAYVSHIDPDNPKAFRSVVFGGQEEEMLTGLASDGRGGLFAVGYTKSKDFPTVRPIQGALRGVSDLFLTRLDARSLTPTFSTFFGGSGDDSGWGVTTDRNGDPIVAGASDSKDLPTSARAYQPANKGGRDAFIARFEGAGYRKVRATYFGGTKDDQGGGDGDDVKVDGRGNTWLVGWTKSPDLPTRNALQPEFGGGDTDGFLAAFSPDLAQLCYSTYRGGSATDTLEGVDLSKTGLVFVTGETSSPDLPMPAKSIQNALAPVNVEGIGIVNATVFALQLSEPCQGNGSHEEKQTLSHKRPSR
jgi:hypothetical protein